MTFLTTYMQAEEPDRTEPVGIRMRPPGVTGSRFDPLSYGLQVPAVEAPDVLTVEDADDLGIALDD